MTDVSVGRLSTRKKRWEKSNFFKDKKWSSLEDRKKRGRCDVRICLRETTLGIEGNGLMDEKSKVKMP